MIYLGLIKVVVDRNKCIACGVAPAVCPEVFVLDGKTRIVGKYSKQTDANISIGEVPEELRECVVNAANSCPVNAISVE